MKAAGLPNIKGGITGPARRGWGFAGGGGATNNGAFTAINNGEDHYITGNNRYGQLDGFTFDASKGTTKLDGTYMTQAESPYGKTTTVQPASYTVVYIMKVR